MKYFLYISDTKIDMLYAQIPRKFLDGVAGELKVDLKVLSVSLKQSASPETRYSKLDVVCRYVDQTLDVGDIDTPAMYFRGATKVRWGPYGSGNRLVYFGGRTDRTVFGLGGSEHHVIGSPTVAAVHSASATPYLAAILSEDLKFPLPTNQEIEGLAIEDMKPTALHAAFLATSDLKGPEQDVEFLAKRLLFTNGESRSKDEWWKPESTNVLLGSPLYVALCE